MCLGQNALWSHSSTSSSVSCWWCCAASWCAREPGWPRSCRRAPSDPFEADGVLRMTKEMIISSTRHDAAAEPESLEAGANGADRDVAGAAPVPDVGAGDETAADAAARPAARP